MPVRYLYLDDESIEDTQSIADLLEAEHKELKIDVENPLSFSNQIQKLKDSKYDGLLLDLRLDQIKNDQKAEYRASTLAQELRTRSTEGLIKNFPIVICSTDSKLKRSYNKSIVGQDLFDAKYLKVEEMLDEPSRVSKELVSLAKGYIQLSKIKGKKKNISLSDFFCLTKKNIEQLDDRLVKHFFGTSLQLPIYEYARFILKEMILKPGVLINKEILLARLGVDAGSKNHLKLLELLNSFKYKGPFHEAWELWWWPLVNNWWYGLKAGIPGLTNLMATERVEILNGVTKLRLQPAKPIYKTYSTKYWTICHLYNTPLDPFDGLLLDMGYEPLPWQESIYVSLKAAADPKMQARPFTISTVDKQRFADYKKLSK